MPLEVLILMGLQGSGKSTLYHQQFTQTHTLISKDLFPNNRNKSRRQRQLLEEALKRGTSVVVDNTNPTREERAEIIAVAQQFEARVVGYVFPPDVPTSLKRNAQRAGKARVPDVGIYATIAKWQSPSLMEGFDQLFTVTTTETGDFTFQPWIPP